jgi:hypothetical protein
MIDTVKSISQAAKNAISGVELFLVFVFTLELIIRIWVCVEKPDYRDKSFIRGTKAL